MTPATPTPRVARHPQGEIAYLLTRKQVKHINMRVTRQGQVLVSAPSRVGVRTIDAFVVSKADWIQRARERMAQSPAPTVTPKRDSKQCQQDFTQLVAALLPACAPFGVTMPQVCARTMKSRWGSCSPHLHKITLNTRLFDYPSGCARMVILHELCHFVHPNHSKEFYKLLTQVCPDWRTYDALLRKPPAKEKAPDLV